MQWLKLVFLFVLFMLTAGVFADPKPGNAGVVWPPTPAKQPTVQRESVVYYLSPGFVLTARNIKTRKLLWTKDYDPKRFFDHKWVTAEPNQLALLSDHGTLYAGDRFGMTAYRAADGQQVWRGTYRYGVDGPPFIKEGVIVNSFQSDGAITMEAIQATDAQTGRYLWTAMGVFSLDPPGYQKGYLVYKLYPFPGSGLKLGQKCLINIHTGERHRL